MSDQIKVQVRHLTKKFGDLLVLDDVSFDVMDGDLLCVVGPTGCGKTTFLNSLVNIYDITSGEILLDGQKVNTKKQNIAYIFQGNSTMPWLTVEENVGFGLLYKPFRCGKERADGKVFRNRGIKPIQEILSKTALCKHASEGEYCQSICHRAGAAADG